MFREVKQVALAIARKSNSKKEGQPGRGLHQRAHEKKDRDLYKPNLRPDAKVFKRGDGGRVPHQTDPLRVAISV